MDESTLALNLRAGFIRGKARACDGRIDCRFEDVAQHVVDTNADLTQLARDFWDEEPFAAYPCVWCRGWHIGRPWTADELSGAAANSLTYVWALRDAATEALMRTGDRDRVALLMRLYWAIVGVNWAFVPR